jgi:hypothetical protein
LTDADDEDFRKQETGSSEQTNRECLALAILFGAFYPVCWRMAVRRDENKLYYLKRLGSIILAQSLA